MPRNDAVIPREIACRQVLREDSSVFSVQWTKLPRRLAAGVTPDWLLDRYLAWIRSFTLTMVRPCRTEDGIEFRLAGTAKSLLRFTAPRRLREAEQDSLSLAICGGMLVQPGQSRRGSLTFAVASEREEVRLTIRLNDYFPLILGSASPSRLRKILYRFTQASTHKVVTIRFLARICRHLGGGDGRVRVIRAEGPQGEEI
ncbi:hypothetical protein [Geobacter sp.]|uniref:hypothetical protein n=1 Tax=Geobacter sp. TaxID=46610 RepID=UPI00260C15F2|nr:hypothetical protein [Geobacter sp.]